jgi:nitrogen fixation/metabolism regulation signal transduction histidine kinase
MGFRNFRFQIIIRVVGICLTMIALAWSLYETEFLMTPLVFGLLTLFQLIALIYYSEWILRELKLFFNAFIDSDYTRRFEDSGKGRAFDDMEKTLNQIIVDFKKIRIEKEAHYQYLLQINKHVNVGLICFTEDGHIDLMNSAACELLNRPVLHQMKMIKNFDVAFFEKIIALKSGEKMLFKSDFYSNPMDLAVVANKFILGDKKYTLLSLQNIHSELEAQEMESWQKLIRVLTHEIMNSVTPVVSLTTAVKKIMEDEHGSRLKINQLEIDQGEDIYKSISAIEKRGEGLLNFVNAYRDYSKIPEPKLETLDLIVVVNDVLEVLKTDLNGSTVNFRTDSEKLALDIDRGLIEQVLINLIKNAAEALTETPNPSISINLNSSNGIIISIADNGPGIPKAMQEEIFVPFFTTKPNGNGIGLSLSKQIMKAHGGDLKLISSNQGTRFEISF